MTNSILIAGGTGLIGKRLTEVLLQKGCRVSHLGRSVRKTGVPFFRWNPEEGHLDDNAWEGVDTLINLAGAGLAEKRWSSLRKEEILRSRLNATDLLVKALRSGNHNVRTVIQGSAIGYYGVGEEARSFNEDDRPGEDFLASVVVKWERAADGLEAPGLRLVKIRTGIVLSDRGGALKEMLWPVRWGVGAPLGNGRQVMSWIHIDDLCELIAWVVRTDSIRGPLNAVAPNPVTNREFTFALARQLKRPLWLPGVPAVVLRLMLGQMADMVLYGSRISCEKIAQQGFQFRFPYLAQALENLLHG